MKWIHAAALAASMALLACASGNELLRVHAESHGDALVATNGNVTVIVADGRGVVELTSASEPFGVLQPPIDWAGKYVRVIARDPATDETFALGEPLPLEVARLVALVLTPEQMDAANLRPAIQP